MQEKSLKGTASHRKSSNKNYASNNFPRSNKIQQNTNGIWSSSAYRLSDFQQTIGFLLKDDWNTSPSFIYRPPWIFILKQKASLGLVFLPAKKMCGFNTSLGNYKLCMTEFIAYKE